ncbi:SMP-30/gluconolactonase/LRE family protein [Roseomonas marmotae]|uniref:SMP-30/gluconolactonase/LRE family protein n=1 Tax=Roseomonas marmotae TaxID=2768161 RepID=A0ABS3KHH3_9PROT|nr:SMP-30/gluconolactonase/LRE family protein [Roseomonas marmotae]MBO1076912.1 SMP-30/gluconolactonase/LRE family protein [Roseomonas marmotae]
MQPIVLEAVDTVGSDLSRPECVLALRGGTLYVSDKRGGITRIAPDGTQRLLGQGPVVPNGIALLRDGSFAIANLSDSGGVWRLSPDGSLAQEIDEIAGRRLGSVNFVRTDRQGRLWICVSTLRPGEDQYRTDIADGFIALRDASGIRVVAEDLCWTNECLPDEDAGYLYVNETFGRRLTRFDLAADGSLSNRVTLASFGHGDYPDGLTQDAEGGLWVVSVGSNRLIRVAPDGTKTVILEDSDAAHLEALEQALQAKRLTRPMIHEARSRRLRNISSLAFSGPDLRTGLMGSLADDTLARFAAPVAGKAPVHWDWPAP